MGVRSDQSVLELLARLEKSNYVERDTNQARGTRLKTQTHLVLGNPATSSGQPTDTLAEIKLQQSKVAEGLRFMDEKLARMYLGAIHVLNDESNPERIAHSAHSLREITNHLSAQAEGLLTKKEEGDLRKQSQSIRVVRFKRLFDPRNGVNVFDQSVYDLWNKQFYEYFTKVSHHADVALEEFKSRLQDFEQFLVKYVFPLQTEIYEHIDQMLASGAVSADPAELKLLLSINVESFAYFFKNVSADWLPFLQKQGFIRVCWDVCHYLARIAEERPTEVLDVLLKLDTAGEGWRFEDSFLTAARKMPPQISSRLVDKIIKEKWVESSPRRIVCYAFRDYLNYLLSNQEHKQALRLSRSLLAVYVPGASSAQAQFRSGRVRGYLDDHDYKTIADVLKAASNDALKPAIHLLKTILCQAIAFDIEPDTRRDHSDSWRSAIEDHEQNWEHETVFESLLRVLRDLLERRIAVLKETDPAKLRVELSELLEYDPEYCILAQLKLHVYRLHPHEFLAEIEDAVLRYLDESETWHEYARLLDEVFPLLPREIQRKYFAALQTGHAANKARKHHHHWQLRRYAIVRRHLKGNAKEAYERLVRKLGDLAHPDFLSTHSFHSGPNAPIDRAQLAEFKIEELVHFLGTWAPDGNVFSPSRGGLASVLQEITQANPAQYSGSCVAFLGLRPIYISSVFSGLMLASRQKATEINWKSVLKAALELAERGRNRLLSDGDDDSDPDLESTWNGVFKSILALIQEGLRQDKFEATYQSEVFEVSA